MPTRIKPDRIGYSGYNCVGIPDPCINQMNGTTNRFDCLPKTATRVVTNTVYTDLGDIAADTTLQTLLASTDTHYDPLNDGVFVDLYGVFVRNGLGSLIDVTCDYVYACSEPTGLPPESQSKRQVNVSVGFIDPPSTNMDAIGLFVEEDIEVDSSLSSESSESSLSFSSISGGSSSGSDFSGGQSSEGETSVSTVSVTVLTALKLDEYADLRIKTRVIYVPSAEDESDWASVEGWSVTECP